MQRNETGILAATSVETAMPETDPELQANSRIDLTQEHEVRYWAQKLGCTESKLRRAVSRLGTSVEAIRRVFAASKARVAQ